MKTNCFKFIIPFFLIFSNISHAQLTPSFVGDAISIGQDCYQITDDLPGQIGGVWYNNPINFNSNFEIIFDANFGSNDVFGADGMNLVFKTTATPEFGNSGGGIGYQGINNSLAIEFDTWENADKGDIVADHMAITSNGNSNHTAASSLVAPINISATSNNVEDGNFHEIKIRWIAATKTLNVYFDCDQRISYTSDLVNTIFGGNINNYFGFVGSTGGYSNVHQICFKHLSFEQTESLLDQEICFGGTVNNIDATYDGATSYNWSPATGVSDVTIANPIFTPTTDTTYTVTITDACGETVTNSFNVTVFPDLMANVAVTSTEACDGDDAIFNITGTPNTIVTYNINSGPDQTITLDASGNASITIPAITTDQTINITAIATGIGGTTTGNGLSATGGFNPDRATGPIDPAGTAASSANCARISSAITTLNMTLEDTVPAGTDITISIAKSNTAATVSISDGATTNIFNSGALDILQHIIFTTSIATNTLVFTRTSGQSWIDGVAYNITSNHCSKTLSDSETITTTSGDSSFLITPNCNGGTASITGVSGGTFAFNPAPTDSAVIDSATGTVTNGTPGASYTIEYTTNGLCASSTTQILNVHPIPTISNPTPLVACDSDIPDGMIELDLTVKNNEISNSNTNYLVTYYNSLTAAQLGTPQVLPSDTEYIATDGETVYVRVEDITTGCYTTTSLLINITTGPSVTTPNPLRECDPENDGLATFDLSSVRDAILATDATLDVSFHLSLQEAIENANPQNNSLNNVAAQTIYVRVNYGSSLDCPTIVELVLTIEPTPEIPTNINPYALCDDDTDGMAFFDLNTMDATIYGTQNPSAYDLTYHESLADAQAFPAMNPINEPQLSNYFSGNTTIYIRLEGLNNCLSVGEFDLIVNSQPTIPVVAQDSIYEICDDTNDNDGFATFNLTTQNDALTNGNQTLAVNYFESIADIPNNPIADYTSYDNISVGGLPHNPQTIFVTVTDTTNSNACYAETSLTLQVNALPNPNDNLEDLKKCDYNNSGDLEEVFDLTENESDIFANFDETITYYQTLNAAELGTNPIPITQLNNYTSTSQTIYVRVTNTGDPADTSDNGTGCYTIVTFDLIVNPIPVFIPEDLYLICTDANGSALFESPIIDTELNPTAYTFQWIDSNNTVVGTDASYTATDSGIHTVEITNIDSGCFVIIPIVVEESATPILNAEVSTEAFADDHTIIATATGSIDAMFEFNIDNGPWLSNIPNDNTFTFTNLTYGEHTIMVRDINGCGSASETVQIIDYPLFFTPNNDGINDTWQINGIQANATIFIFDRYGKLLKQLSPTSTGWDGTFNGSPLPSSDYWFSVDYKDPLNDSNKQFVAHFTLKR